MNVNIELSLKIKKAVDAQRRACFRNAALGQQIVGGEALYCEGYAVQPDLGFPIEHAWIELNGEIIDPTWDKLEGNTYVSTGCFTASEMMAMAGQHEDGLNFPVVIFHAANRGEASRKHQESFEQAFAISKGEK